MSKFLNEDILYELTQRCHSTVDMYNLLIATGFNETEIASLRGFWVNSYLTSPCHNDQCLLTYAKIVGFNTTKLRCDNLSHLKANQIRRLFTYFPSINTFHSGNVHLSKATCEYLIKLSNLKNLTLYIPISQHANPSDFYIYSTDIFENLCHSLTRSNLKQISLVIQSIDGRLPDQCVQNCINALTTMTCCEIITLEELNYDESRLYPTLFSSDHIQTYIPLVIQKLSSSLKHLIVSFCHSMLLTNKNNLSSIVEEYTKLQLFTLCLPSIPPCFDWIDLLQLRTLCIEYATFTEENSQSLQSLFENNQQQSRQLQNLALSLTKQWLTTLESHLVKRTTTTTAIMDQTNVETKIFSSIFDDCFSEPDILLIDDEKESEPMDDSFMIENTNNNSESYYYLEFSHPSSIRTRTNTTLPILRLKLDNQWLRSLTNLNLTGIHCHSNNFTYLFQQLINVETLSITPCTLIYIDNNLCHCNNTNVLSIYQTHFCSFSSMVQLKSLNIVCGVNNMKEKCFILEDDYRYHCLRYDETHIHDEIFDIVFYYEEIIRYCLQNIAYTLIQLHHLSIRMPFYELKINDLNLICQKFSSYLETLVIDVKGVSQLHITINVLLSRNILSKLKTFIVVDDSFILTKQLLDNLSKQSQLEIIEIYSNKSDLNKDLIIYIEKNMNINIFSSLHTFRLIVNSVSSIQLIKTVKINIEKSFSTVKPGFLFDIITNSHANLSKIITVPVLFDGKYLHKKFHSIKSNYQLSISYPSNLNYQTLYSEQLDNLYRKI